MENFQCSLYSWSQMWSFSEDLALKVRDSGYCPDYIIAITRGGLVPAVNLSDLLGVHDMGTLRVRHWSKTAEKDNKPSLTAGIDEDISGKNILVVDDLTDTGGSLKVAYEYVLGLNPLEVKTATLFHKVCSEIVPDYFAEQVDAWKWIILPWNMVEDLGSLCMKAIEKSNSRDLNVISKELLESFGLEVDEKTLSEVLMYA